jgi:hypothetical protein
MTHWTQDETDRLAAAPQIQIAPRAPDGSLRPFTTISCVRRGNELYVRSWRGPSGCWFSTASRWRAGRVRSAGVEHDVAFVDNDATREAVDAAYRQKYGGSSYVDAMVTDDAAASTLRLVPR